MGLKQQLPKLQLFFQLKKNKNFIECLFHSLSNIGFNFNKHVISFTNIVSTMSKSCHSRIRKLCHIRPYFDFKQVDIIFFHSECEYFNSLHDRMCRALLLAMLLKHLNWAIFISLSCQISIFCKKN